jgi:hypothetical protein
MLGNLPTVQVSDTSGADSSNVADLIILLRKVHGQ